MSHLGDEVDGSVSNRKCLEPLWMTYISIVQWLSW